MTETFSFYKGGIWITTPHSKINIPELIELLKGDKYKSVVEQLRNLKTKEEVRKFKQTCRELDYVTVGGIFEVRGKERITNPSGLMCADIDDIKDLNAVRSKLLLNKFVHVCFVSPSGKGLKVIVKIPIDENYENYFITFCNSLNITTDKSTRDISRACFLSHDPDVYYNAESEVWTKHIEEVFEEVGLGDKSRSAYEWREIISLLKSGKTESEIRQIAKTQKVKWDKVNSWEKWNEEGEHYKTETFKKAKSYLEKNKPTETELNVEFPTVTLPEAVKNHKPKEWLIKGLLPTKGIVYIGGAPKCFKSTLAFHLAICFATGKDFINHFEVKKKCKILFIQEENDEDMLEKFSLLIKGMFFQNEEDIKLLNNIHLSLCNGITIDTLGGRPEMAINRILKKIEEIQPDVIFFDSAVRMMEGDENKATDVRRVHNTLKKISKERDILCILLHHTSKKDNVLRGSGDFIAQADTVIMLSSKPKYNGLVYAEIPYNRGAPGNFNQFSFRVYSLDKEHGKMIGDIDIDNINSMQFGEYNCDCDTIDKDREQVANWITAINLGKQFSMDTIKMNLVDCGGNWNFSKRTLQRILNGFVDKRMLSMTGKTKNIIYKLMDSEEGTENED